MPLALIFIALGWGVLFVAQIVEGGSPASLFSHPAPLILVFGVTHMVTCVGNSFGDLKVVMKGTLRALFPKKVPAPAEAVKSLAALADVARRDGLLALEKQLDSLGDSDPYLRRGVELILDNTDSERLQEVLYAEIEAMEQRHRVAATYWQKAGGYAPTVGILGTVMSLVHVLENLAEPGKLGGSIAAAFLATLWGVGSANLIYLPLAEKLKRLSAVEVVHRGLVAEGLIDVQAGASPRSLTEKLKSHLPPGDRAKLAGEGS